MKLAKLLCFAGIACLSLTYLTSCQTVEEPKAEGVTWTADAPTVEQRVKVANDAAARAAYILATDISPLSGYANTHATVDASVITWNATTETATFPVKLSWKAKVDGITTSAGECIVEGIISVNYSNRTSGSITATFIPKSSNDWAKRVASGSESKLTKSRVFDPYNK